MIIDVLLDDSSFTWCSYYNELTSSLMFYMLEEDVSD